MAVLERKVVLLQHSLGSLRKITLGVRASVPGTNNMADDLRAAYTQVEEDAFQLNKDILVAAGVVTGTDRLPHSNVGKSIPFYSEIMTHTVYMWLTGIVVRAAVDTDIAAALYPHVLINRERVHALLGKQPMVTRLRKHNIVPFFTMMPPPRMFLLPSPMPIVFYTTRDPHALDNQQHPGHFHHQGSWQTCA